MQNILNYFAYLAIIIVIIYFTLVFTNKQLQTNIQYVTMSLLVIIIAVGIITRIYKYYASIDTVKKLLEH